jgi:histidinol-phosphatase (PHP family)
MDKHELKTMNKINLHTHSIFCDGSSQLENYVDKAIELNFQGIGFSSHAPIGFKTDWHMKKEDFQRYHKQISQLKTEYKDKIEIWTGLEVDYFDNEEYEFDFNNSNLDFAIGAVHYLKPDIDYCIDESKEKLKNILSNEYKNDNKSLIREYYNKIVSMIFTRDFDIIAHFDLIKKFNAKNYFFDEDAKWYKKIVFETIDKLKVKDPIFEVNSRGFYKGQTNEFYPSNWILEYLIKNGFRITVNTDAHNPNEINEQFDSMINNLIKMGLREISVFKNNRWVKESLSLTHDDDGIPFGIHRIS